MSTISTSDSGFERVSWTRAFVHTAALGVLFFVVYGTTAWITSLRSDVGTWHYSWERYIPFVPIMIVPYMSLDLFFAAGPFLCRDRRELRLLSSRITAAILIAGACFLIYPLQLAVERQTAPGLLGEIWRWFVSVEQPYNLLPSLHIALRTIFADLYARHTAGLLRVASNVWFSLIGASTLLTYQHHVVDVIGGFILAAVCFYFVSDVPHRLPMVRNTRVGWKYAGLGVALAALTAVTWPYGATLLWPTVAVAIVTAGYFFIGPSIFRKQFGRMPLSAKVILAPVLLGQYISWHFYKRQGDAWNEITPSVWIGRWLTEKEASEAVRRGVTAIVDLSDTFSEASAFLSQSYLHLPVLDLTSPTRQQVDEAVYFINAHATQGIVYVHCKVGYSRSAGIVGAWLLATGRMTTVEQTIEELRGRRPSIVIRPEIRTMLDDYARTL